MISILLLLAIIFFAYKVSPKEGKEEAQKHGVGQVGLIAALALFGVDYFTSYYYATGEMMSALHPYGLQGWAYLAVVVIAVANIVFGFLYMHSLGIFNEGGGSYTASMRYLMPTVSLIVAVTLIQDYILTIVVSALSGVDQLLSVLNAYDSHWLIHFGIGASLAFATCYLTVRGRGESAKIVFMFLTIFGLLTATMAVGLFFAVSHGAPAIATEGPRQAVPIGQALLHLLTASMKGMVALTGLEAMSNGIQFVIDDDSDFIKWGKKRLPQFMGIWNYYSGKSGIGRLVQTSFLFYGGITTLLLTFFSIRFNVFDGTMGRTLVGNLAYIGFSQIPGGNILYWAYQMLAVVLLAAASMTAFQDVQATAWRDVAIGEMPQFVAHRNDHGTFTRSVWAAFFLSLIIMLIVRGSTTAAIPFYGVGVFMPIMVMGIAIARHINKMENGVKKYVGSILAYFAAALAAAVFVGQITGKWSEGGWVVLVSFSFLIVLAHILLLLPQGKRDKKTIINIVRDIARIRGTMALIVEWQSYKMQEYRYSLLKLPFFSAVFAQKEVSAPFKAGHYEDFMASEHQSEEPIQLLHNIKITPIADEQILVPVYGEFSQTLYNFVGDYAKKASKAVVLLYIHDKFQEKRTVGEVLELEPSVKKFLTKAKEIVDTFGVQTYIVYELSDDIAGTINSFRRKIHPSLTVITPHKQRDILDFLQGDILSKVFSAKNGQVLFYSGSDNVHLKKTNKASFKVKSKRSRKMRTSLNEHTEQLAYAIVKKK